MRGALITSSMSTAGGKYLRSSTWTTTSWRTGRVCRAVWPAGVGRRVAGLVSLGHNHRWGAWARVTRRAPCPAPPPPSPLPRPSHRGGAALCSHHSLTEQLRQSKLEERLCFVSGAYIVILQICTILPVSNSALLDIRHKTELVAMFQYHQHFSYLPHLVKSINETEGLFIFSFITRSTIMTRTSLTSPCYSDSCYLANLW